jgi:hypothetical protein
MYVCSLRLTPNQGDGAMLRKTDNLLLKSKADNIYSLELRGNVSCPKHSMTVLF